RERRATWRVDARMRGRIQAAVVGFILIVLFFVLKPIYDNFVGIRELQTCQTNVLHIAHALQQYAQDWDGAYPPAESWMTAAMGGMAPLSNSGFDISHYFHCPLDNSGSASSYAYNDLLAGISPEVKSNDASRESQR